MAYQKLWIALGFVLVISFAVLGGVRVKVLRSALSIPESPGAAVGRGML